MASPTTIKDYIVVSASSISTLQSAVVTKMNAGYICQGGVETSQATFGGTITYLQAMVKYTFM